MPLPDHPSETVLELRRLQVLARAAGVSFTFPLLVYGLAAVVSGVLLAAVTTNGLSIWVYNGWWAVVALSAPVLITRHYEHRLSARGIGISRNRAGRYAAATEALAVLLWFGHPLYPVQISAPWLAFAVGAAVVGRVWHNRTLLVVAAAVTLIVVTAAAWHWPMHVTDLLIGVVLCAGALRRPRRGGPVRELLPPTWQGV